MYDTPEARKLHRTSLIKAWFEDLRGSAGFALLSWERRMSIDELWEMILEMIFLAPDDECLGTVAAGPLESLLSDYGEQVIDRVETQSVTDPKFARALHSLYRLTMTDEVWARVQALRLKFPKPSDTRSLPESG